MSKNAHLLVQESTDRFCHWLDEKGYHSFDPYDLWGTRFGLWARSVYYKRGKLGIPLILPIVAAEMICPSVRRLFVKKKRYATADAQIALAYANLHEVDKNGGWLDKAVAITKEILEYSIPGYSGLCWGYPFDWQNNKAMWPKNTPYITCTPYCYEVFVKLHELTKDDLYLEHAKSVAKFVSKDLKETPYSDNATAGSYSPLDNSMVVNASAYRAFVLIDAGIRFSNDSYKQSGLRNLRFVQQSQNEDGSWLYGLDTPADRFIDHFHTCFNLKNLLKIEKIYPSDTLRKTIDSGFSWHRANLYQEDGRPRSFAKEPRFQTAKLEMYNYAESITLGTLAKDRLPHAWTMAVDLAKDLIENFQYPDGHFTTRTFAFGKKHSLPFIRWPQAQIFLALSNLHKSMAGSSANSQQN